MGMPPSPTTPIAPPTPEQAPQQPSPQLPPQDSPKDLPVNGIKLINAIDLMDPDRILRYVKTMQSGIVNLQDDEYNIDHEIDASDNKINPQQDTNKKMLTSKDIINRYLFIRRIAAAAADVIRTLSSERIQNAQIEADPNMPDLSAEATPQASSGPEGIPT